MDKNIENTIFNTSYKTSRNTIIFNTSLICIFIWLIVLYIFKSRLMKPLKFTGMTLLILFPILCIIYHGIIEMKYGQDVDKDKEKKTIIKNMKRENNLANIIPVIIFGYGYLIKNGIVNPRLSNIVIPFLVASLLLGTVIPYIIVYNSFNDCSIQKLLTTEIIMFSSETASLALLFACCFITMIRV